MQRGYKLTNYVAVAVLLGGCQQQNDRAANPSVSAARPAPAGFECPRPGTRVAFSEYDVRTYTGVDPSDSFTCTFNNVAGEPGRRLANWFPFPISDEAKIREALANVWPLETGRSVSFVRQVTNSAGANWQIRSTFRVLEPQRVEIAGETRDVILIQLDQENPQGQWGGYAVRWTIFYDRRSRTPIRGDVETLRGQGSDRNYIATSISVPDR